VKAAVLHEVGQPVQIEDLAVDDPPAPSICQACSVELPSLPRSAPGLSRAAASKGIIGAGGVGLNLTLL
jgi:hypothetical protein